MNALKHLYCHVPFCDGKCLYCAFYSTVYEPEKTEQYLDELTEQFDSHLSESEKPEPETIYIGGGTPSILSIDYLEKLTGIIRERVSTTQLKEWTVEANPGSLPPEKIKMLISAGVNRISFGAQSFDDDILGLIGRRHKVADTIESFKAVRNAGIKNIGIDLIANLPEVDNEKWASTLYDAIDLGPEHISIYDLSVEKGTVLHDLVRNRKVSLPHENAQIETLDTAELLLEQAGYQHYEISNYAKPGCESLHNLACWRGKDYLGLGPSASSRVERNRWSWAPEKEEEYLSIADDLSERFIFGFRLKEGVDIEAFCEEFGPVPDKLRSRWEQTVYKLRDDGLLEEESGRWKLTKQGRHLADHVVRELL